MSGQDGEQEDSGQDNPNVPDGKVKVIKDPAKLFDPDRSKTLTRN